MLDKTSWRILRLELFILVLIFMVLAMLGAIMNQMAMISNNGKMPVKDCMNTLSTEHYCFYFSEEVRNYQLVDRFVFRFFYLKITYSLGDIFIYSGGFGATILILVLGVLSIKFYIERFINKKD